MARYLVLEKSYIGNSLVEAGAEVEFDGDAGTNLQLIEETPAPKKTSAKKPAAAGTDGADLT